MAVYDWRLPKYTVTTPDPLTWARKKNSERSKSFGLKEETSSPIALGNNHANRQSSSVWTVSHPFMCGCPIWSKPYSLITGEHLFPAPLFISSLRCPAPCPRFSRPECRCEMRAIWFPGTLGRWNLFTDRHNGELLCIRELCRLGPVQHIWLPACPKARNSQPGQEIASLAL